MIGSPLEDGGASEADNLRVLSTSPGSFLGCCRSVEGAVFSSLLLDVGVDGLDEDTVGAGAAMVTATSSENNDMSWSSSRRSNIFKFDTVVVVIMGTALESLHSSSTNGCSRKAMESLMERR